MKCIEDEIPFALPEGWGWCRLRNLSSVISKGTTPKAGKSAYIDGDIGFVRIENLTDNYSISHEDMKYISNTIHSNELKRSILQEHDLLITIAGTLVKTAVVRKENLPLNTNQAIAFVRFIDFEAINILFYCLIISSNTIKNRLLLQTKVTSIPNLTLEIISNCLIPLPPSHEQHRIVAKLNELFEFVNTIESEKTDLLSAIRLAKSKILDLAIRGKLVPQDPSDEPASVLLSRIRAEKQELIKQGKIKPEKGIVCGDSSPFEKLPNGWEWTRLGNVFNLIMGQAPNGNEVFEGNNGIEFHQGKIFFGKMYINSSNQSTNRPHKIAPANSVLLCVRAPVGKVNITDREICIGRGLCALVPMDKITAQFAFYWLLTLESKFIEQATGTTFTAITGDVIKSQIIPIPPLPEQHRIADTVKKYFDILDDIEKSLG